MQLRYEISTPYARWNGKFSGRPIQKCLLRLEESSSCSCPKEKLLAWLLIHFYSLYFWGLEISWHLLAPQCPRRTRPNFLSQNIELLMQKSRKNYYHLWHWSQGWNSCQQTKVWPGSRFPPSYYVTIMYKLLHIKTTVSLQSPVLFDLQSQAIQALNSVALWWVVPSWDAVTKGSTTRSASREAWEHLHRPGHFSWQCLVAVHCHPVHRLATMASIRQTFASHFPVYISQGRTGLGCKGSTLCYSPRPSPLRSDHFSPYNVLAPRCPCPTFPLIHFRSCPTSTRIPVAPPALTPKSSGSPPSFLHPITFQSTSCTGPFIQCPHSCPRGSALLHMVLGADCLQSFPSILPQCQQWEEWERRRDHLHVLSSKYHSSPWR